MVIAGPSAFAEEIRIFGGDCASRVHLVARDAHLSEVLKHLAQALEFKLRYEARSDPVVSIDVALKPDELVARLATSVNFSMAQGRSPKCRHQQRILNLVVLPNAAENRPPAPASPPPLSRPQETPEQARQAQEGIDQFRKSHGGGDPSDVGQAQPQ